MKCVKTIKENFLWWNMLVLVCTWVYTHTCTHTHAYTQRQTQTLSGHVGFTDHVNLSIGIHILHILGTQWMEIISHWCLKSSSGSPPTPEHYLPYRSLPGSFWLLQSPQAPCFCMHFALCQEAPFNPPGRPQSFYLLCHYLSQYQTCLGYL